MGRKFWEKVRIVHNTRVAEATYCMKFVAQNIATEAQAGQFLMLRVNNADTPLLNRPLGIAGVEADGVVTVYYRVVGKGTDILTRAEVGQEIFAVGPLGNTFTPKQSPLLIGGGIGLAPLLFTAQKMSVPTDVIIGIRSKDELFWQPLFAQYCTNVYVTSDDGSCGVKGNCVSILPPMLSSHRYDTVMVCGPTPMLRAVAEACEPYPILCQLSLEKHMACGFGVCLTCTCEADNGDFLQVCKHGPVFDAKDVKI